MIWRGTNALYWLSPPSDPVTSLPLPEGTEVGDWLYVVGHAGVSFTVTDGRMTRAAILDTPGDEYGEAWVGQATTLGDLTFTAETGVIGATVIIAASPNQPNLNRVATVTSTTSDFTLPGVPGSGGGAVALLVGAHGIGGSSWQEPPLWQKVTQTGSYVSAAIGSTDEAVVESAATSWTHVTDQMRVAGVVIGVGGFTYTAPPCRIFPREDGLGVGGGRNYPPAKSQQRSSRGVGYY